MQNRELLTEDALRKALGPTDDCPTLEELESLASGEAIAGGRWAGHLQVCGYCQTELHLLQAFLAEKPREANAEKAAELLEKKRQEIFKPTLPVPRIVPWWKTAFAVRRLAQASFAMAAILVVVGAVLFFRSTSSQPQLEARNQTGPEVLRSTGFSVLSPSGDLQQRPQEIRWEQVSKAARYQVRLLEVDRSELWEVSTPSSRIELPAAVQNRIVPAKTLFVEITAFDSAGSQLATTGLVRFRVVQGSK